MRFKGQKIRARGDDWIEVEAPEGPAILRGYDPALIEYESLEEAKAERERVLILAANEDYEAIFTARIELDYILIRRMMGQTISAAQQQKARDVLALFEALEAKIRQVRQAQTVEEVEAVVW